MLQIPILRHGQPYESVDQIDIVHHATGEVVARVSQANSGMISRDIARMDHRVLERFTVAELMAMCRRAGELFLTATLPCGNEQQSFDDYVGLLSATTGMPVTYCRNNAGKIHRMCMEIETVIAGLTRGFPLEVIDNGHGNVAGHTLSFFRVAKCLGAVLPSNSPGVHSLWIPAVALKTPLVLKPGREEPWSPYRIIQAFIAAGVPGEAFGFYPTDHAGAGELLRSCDRSMLFGGSETTKPYENDSRVELHGPGYSKIILGPDVADDWERHIDVMIGSISANGGRSCINASGVWTPKNGRAIAEALAARLASVQALPADDPRAEIAAFANSRMADMISQSIDSQLGGGAVDLTAEKRGGPRLVKIAHPIHTTNQSRDLKGAVDEADQSRDRKGAMGLTAEPACDEAVNANTDQRDADATAGDSREIAYLLPTIIWIEPHATNSALGDEPSWRHPLANKEYLFPFASVVECPADELPDAIGQTLVGTVISGDKAFLAAISAAGHIDRLNIGPIPTYQLSWDQPHEGNLFEHLYRQRAFQMIMA